MSSVPPLPPADPQIRRARACAPPARTRIRAGGQQGFSLLEVVVAFAILALSLGVLMQIFAAALNTTALSGEYSRAATLAEARLNAVGVDIPLEPGSYGEALDDGSSWEVFIAPYLPEGLPFEPSMELFLVTATASFGDPERRRRIILTTLRLADAGAFGADAAGAVGARPPSRGEALQIPRDRR